MIYLIDDNQNNQRINQYEIEFVEQNLFPKHLKSIEKLEKKGEANDISHIKFLSNAACILLHSTTEDVDASGNFIKGSKTNSIKIKEFISDEGTKVPLVLFSNSMDEVADFDYQNNPNFIRSIKKNKMYERLLAFIQNYKDTGAVELRIIAFGKNYLGQEIHEFAKQLLSPIALKKASEYLHITDIQNKAAFESFITNSFPNLNWKKILFDLEDNPMKIDKFREKINLITESFFKYGKNIYNW